MPIYQCWGSKPFVQVLHSNFCVFACRPAVPVFYCAIPSVIQLHDHKENKPEQWGCCTRIAWSAMSTGRILQMNNKGQNQVGASLAGTKEGICVTALMSPLQRLIHLCKISNSKWQWKAETVFLLSWQTSRHMTRGENSKAAEDTNCLFLIPGASISQTLFQGKGHNKISEFFFIWTVDKDLGHIFVTLSYLYHHTVLSTFHFWL